MKYTDYREAELMDPAAFKYIHGDMYIQEMESLAGEPLPQLRKQLVDINRLIDERFILPVRAVSRRSGLIDYVYYVIGGLDIPELIEEGFRKEKSEGHLAPMLIWRPRHFIKTKAGVFLRNRMQYIDWAVTSFDSGRSGLSPDIYKKKLQDSGRAIVSCRSLGMKPMLGMARLYSKPMAGGTYRSYNWGWKIPGKPVFLYGPSHQCLLGLDRVLEERARITLPEAIASFQQHTVGRLNNMREYLTEKYDCVFDAEAVMRGETSDISTDIPGICGFPIGEETAQWLQMQITNKVLDMPLEDLLKVL